MEVLIYDKTLEFEIVPKLQHSEFRCKCSHEDCTFTMLNHRVSLAFDVIRGIWWSAIGVSSGFRCQRHNKISNGMDNSWHKKGCAIDIFPHNGDLIGLYKLADKFFDLVILYEEDGFIHCQMEE